MSTGPDTPESSQPPEGQPSSQQQPSQQPPRQPQAPPGHGQPMYAPGPAPMRPEDEKLWAIGAHLGPLVLGLIAPLVVWLVFRDRSAFLDRTGKEALNMQLSFLIYFFVSGLSILVLVGLVLVPLVGLAWLVLMIVASVKVASFEDYRYPAIIRFVS